MANGLEEQEQRLREEAAAATGHNIEKASTVALARRGETTVRFEKETA